MKKFIIFFLAVSLFSCSKDNNEPSDPSNGNNQNQGTETLDPGVGGDTGDLNSTAYNWIGVLTEQTLVNDGIAPVFNTTKECLEWKEKYEQYFTFQDMYVMWYYTWSNTFDYTFAELDSFASEYVGFTMGEFQSTEGYDYYTATFQNYWDVDPTNYSYKGYFLYYTYDESLISETLDDNWVAYFSCVNSGPNYPIPEGYAEWEEANKSYLIIDKDLGTGYDRLWAFPLKYFDNEYVMEKIYPFLQMDQNGYWMTVNVYKKNDGVNRRFVNMGGSLGD